MVAERRLKEIEALKNERIELLQALDAMRIQVATTLQDDKIRESSLFKNVEAELEYHRTENQLLKNRLDKVFVEFEEMQADRRKFVEQLEAEEVGRRKVLEAEIKKLSDDLTRVRGNRDSLQHTLDLRSSKDEAEIVQNEQIRMIANTRKVGRHVPRRAL
ncbi:hypothetical protein DFJ73DRAFT_349021 [Zopfochytrium polystomum]|nr:hypothetical protein DFJ73DRAFT_349021 [Zopfochytrium polystomum]